MSTIISGIFNKNYNLYLVKFKKNVLYDSNIIRTFSKLHLSTSDTFVS